MALPSKYTIFILFVIINRYIIIYSKNVYEVYHIRYIIPYVFFSEPGFLCDIIPKRKSEIKHYFEVTRPDPTVLLFESLYLRNNKKLR